MIRIALALGILLLSLPAFSVEPAGSRDDLERITPPPGVARSAFDAVVLRPLGFLQVVVGAVVLVPSYPVALLVDGDYDNLMVTLKLEVKYRQPTPTGEPLTVIGWVIRESGNRARVAAEIRLADGAVTAQAEAIVTRPPPEFLRRWEPEKPFWRVDED